VSSPARSGAVGMEDFRRLAGILEEDYGPPGRTGHGPTGRRVERRSALDVLVATILSQATSDVNSHRAFRSLKRRFPRWEDAADAPVEEIDVAIRIGGLSATKARRIKELLGQLEERTGAFSLEALRGMTDEEAMGFLQSFEGIGPKTAACVLLFAFGRPVFPVDTHINRVLQRLGFVPGKWDASRTQRGIAGRIPPESALSLHLNLIEHGRRVCTAQRPKCDVCCLAPRCATARGRGAGRSS